MIPLRAARGFTLLELLVALFIAAVMFALGYAALTQVAEQRSAVAQAQQELTSLRRALNTIERDIGEMLPRPVRDPIGTGRLPALRADGSDGLLFSLTRSSAGLPGGAGALRRIDYRLDNGTLLREAWPVLDRTAQGEPVRRALLGELESVSLRFLRAGGESSAEWLPADPRERPLAVEIILVSSQYGRITRLLEVP